LTEINVTHVSRNSR